MPAPQTPEEWEAFRRENFRPDTPVNVGSVWHQPPPTPAEMVEFLERLKTETT